MPQDWFNANAPSAPAGADWFASNAPSSPLRRPVSAEDFMSPEKEGRGIGGFLSDAVESLNPLPLIRSIATSQPDPNHPEDAVFGPLSPFAPLVRGAVGAQVGEGKKAYELAKAGRYTEAAGHAGAAVLPLLGPASAAAGEQIASGDVAGGLGKAAGLIAPVGIGAVKGIRVPALLRADPAAAEALALAERSGVPVDAATATGNKFVKAVQHVSDRSLAGSLVAEGAQKAQQAGLATLGEQLAAKASARAVTAGEAGEAAQRGVSGVVSAQRAAANDAYGRLRAIEEASLKDVAPGEAVPATLPPERAGHFTLPKPKAILTDAQMEDFLTRHGGTGPDMPSTAPASGPSTAPRARVPMIVDMSPVMKAVQPIIERLAAKKAVTGVLMGAEGRAANALQSIVQGPVFVPLSVADSALSDLKSMARTNHPDLRNVGQGLAAKAVGELHQAVTATAKAAGPDAVAALEEGRTATKAKYAAADVLKGLEGVNRAKSPEAAFRAMTRAGDTNANHLEQVLAQAPKSKPLIARAVLDGLIDSPTAGPMKTYADWQRLGPKTKALLYTPEHVKALDAFFKLRKMMADNPNPSGTAHTLLTAAQGGLLLTEPVSGAAVQFGSAALSSLLHSPRGVRLLTKGMRIPLANKAASAAWLTDLAAATSPSGSQTTPAPATGR